jgi:hypothetical protein
MLTQVGTGYADGMRVPGRCSTQIQTYHTRPDIGHASGASMHPAASKLQLTPAPLNGQYNPIVMQGNYQCARRMYPVAMPCSFRAATSCQQLDA